MEPRKKQIYAEMLRLKSELQSLERELTRMERGLPEPWRKDKNFIPEFLRK